MKRILFIFVLSLLWASNALAAPSLTSLIKWKTADGGNDHWYALTEIKMGWEAAESNAMALGGHLVSINSAAENEFITANLATIVFENYWIGFTDKESADVWKWTDGSGQWTSGDTPYTNWRHMEPNDGPDYDPAVNTEMYAMLYSRLGYVGHGQWNDAADNVLYYGVMEFTSAPTPIPGAVWLLGSGLLGLVGVRLRKKD